MRLVEEAMPVKPALGGDRRADLVAWIDLLPRRREAGVRRAQQILGEACDMARFRVGIVPVALRAGCDLNCGL